MCYWGADAWYKIYQACSTTSMASILPFTFKSIMSSANHSGLIVWIFSILILICSLLRTLHAMCTVILIQFWGYLWEKTYFWGRLWVLHMFYGYRGEALNLIWRYFVDFSLLSSRGIELVLRIFEGVHWTCLGYCGGTDLVLIIVKRYSTCFIGILGSIKLILE